MTSPRDRPDDGSFSWPPTQDDLDALNVLDFDDRAGAVPAFWPTTRPRRGRGEPSEDALRRILPERPTIVPPSTSLANVPPPQVRRAPRSARRSVPVNGLALLASGIVIGLGLGVVAGLRQPSTAIVPPGPAVHAAAGGRIEPTPTTAPVRPSPREAAAAAPAPASPPATPANRRATLLAATLAATPSSPPSRPLRDAAPRRTPSAAARVTSAPGVRGSSGPPDALATDGVAADPARPDTVTPADIFEAVPEPDRGGLSASAAADGREPTPASAAPSAASSARPLIGEVLQRYQAAYSSMDVGATRAVWPSVDGRALERAFGTLQEQDLALGACDISIDQDRATAVCPGTVRYRPKVGNTAPQRRNGQWEVQLDRGTRGWAITGVNVR